jgi:hypothetical protein
VRFASWPVLGASGANRLTSESPTGLERLLATDGATRVQARYPNMVPRGDCAILPGQLGRFLVPPWYPKVILKHGLPS